MANPITSKESILKVAREIVSKEGLKALNIRKISSTTPKRALKNIRTFSLSTRLLSKRKI